VGGLGPGAPRPPVNPAMGGPTRRGLVKHCSQPSVRHFIRIRRPSCDSTLKSDKAFYVNVFQRKFRRRCHVKVKRSNIIKG